MTKTMLGLEVPVCIAGLGAQTVVGRTAAAAAAAVRARISRVAEHPYLIDLACEPMLVARAPWLGDEPDAAVRMWNLSAFALREALVPLEPRAVRSGLRLLVSLGLPMPRPGFAAERHRWLGHQLRAALPPDVGSCTVEVVAADHAASLRALELAWRRLTRQEVDVCLIGGVDSFLSAETLNWLEAEGRLYTARNVRGAIPGEAAAFCLLVSSDRCQRFGFRSLGGVVNVATAEEPATLGSRTVCLGKGLSQAFQSVLSVLQPKNRVDHMLCDLNGAPYRADEFAFALARVSDKFARPGVFQTPVDCWGDVGAASGPLALVLAASAWERGYAPGPLTFVSSSSGNTPLRAAALLQAPSTFQSYSPCL